MPELENKNSKQLASFDDEFDILEDETDDI